MSAPSIYEKGAEHIKYGFLATRSRSVINNLLNDKNITEEDIEILKRAQQFIKLLLDGTDFVTTGKYHGNNSRETLAVLSFALDPLEQIQSAAKDIKVSGILKMVGDALSVVISIRQVPSEELRNTLLIASKLFFLIYTSLAESLSLKRRTSSSIHLNLN